MKLISTDGRLILSKLTAQRQDEIKKMLTQHETLKVADLSRQFGVSEVTIRKDLRKLNMLGEILREHGIVREKQSGKFDEDFTKRLGKEALQKERIANHAAALVKPYDVVLLGPGSTCCLLAQKLAAMPDVIIVTNSVSFQPYLPKPRAKIIYLGGEYSALSGSVFGSFAVDMMNTFNINTFFFGANGISLEHGVTSFDFNDTVMVKEMISKSAQTVLISDSTKFETSCAIKLADLKQADIIITGKELCGDVAERYKASDIDIITV